MDITNENIGKNNSDKIWDRVFKTLLLKSPKLFLPLIKEVFGENFDKDTNIVLLNNEYYNSDTTKIETDTSFLVNDKTYHFECQYTNDSTMVFRMFEYGFHVGLLESKRKEDFTKFYFPKACVVYITTNKECPKSLTMEVYFPTGKFDYEIPAIRVQDFTLDEIFEKNLYVFLPYIILRYSKRLKNKNAPTKEEILQVFRNMLDNIELAYNDGNINLYEYNLLIETIKETEQRELVYYESIKKEVDSMVNEVLDLRCIRIQEQADRELQKKEQEIQKKQNTIINMIKKLNEQGNFESFIVEIAEENGITPNELKTILETK